MATQNGNHLADDNFKSISLNENRSILIQFFTEICFPGPTQQEDNIDSENGFAEQVTNHYLNQY